MVGYWDKVGADAACGRAKAYLRYRARRGSRTGVLSDFFVGAGRCDS